MYGKGALVGAATTTTATVAAVTLPNTGGSFIITAAVSLAAGLIAWGALYARAN